MTLEQRLSAFAQAVGADIKSLTASVAALVAGGDWARVGLASDFVNATVAFTDVPGWTCTIPANTNFTIEADLVLSAVATTNLPRFGLTWNAAFAWAVGQVAYDSSASAETAVRALNLTAAGNLQMAAGTAPVAGAYSGRAYLKGRTGGSAVTVKGQLAAESAAANAATLRRSSEFRYRTGP